MFTLWYSILSFKEYRNSVHSGSACLKTNDVRPSSPKPATPSLPVQIPKTKVPDVKPDPVSPVPLRTTPVQVPTPAPARSPVAPSSPRPQAKPSTPPVAPKSFQQNEQHQEIRTRAVQPQPSPLAAKKPQNPVQAPSAKASQQFIKRENSYSSEDEEEEEEDEEDSEIERIDLHK